MFRCALVETNRNAPSNGESKGTGEGTEGDVYRGEKKLTFVYFLYRTQRKEKERHIFANIIIVTRR